MDCIHVVSHLLCPKCYEWVGSPKVQAVQKIAVTNHTAIIMFSQKMGRGEKELQTGDQTEEENIHSQFYITSPSMIDNNSTHIMKSPELNFSKLDLKGSDL